MTDKLREAAQQALEWIEDATAVLSHVSTAIQGGVGAEAEGVGGCSAKVADALRAALAQQDAQAATCKQCLQVGELLDEILEAALAQGESLGAKALRLADAIDPFTRKAPFDHLTSTVAAQTLRALAVAQVPQGWKLVPVEPTEAMCEEGLEDEGHTIRDGKAFAGALYRAMLNAAPTPPAQQDAREEPK